MNDNFYVTKKEKKYMKHYLMFVLRKLLLRTETFSYSHLMFDWYKERDFEIYYLVINIIFINNVFYLVISSETYI